MEKTTTIQINEKTLILLKKLKEELQAGSYEEVIFRKVINQNTKPFGGSLAKYYKNTTLKKVLQDMQDERRKSDRF